MAFVVEDGTGLSTATSLVAVATAVTFWTDRNTNSAFLALATTAEQERALVQASDYVRNARRYRWLGQKNLYAQRMPWPRTGAVERDGMAVPSTVVPWAVAEAVCHLAELVAAGTDLQPLLARGGMITSESVGPISTAYAPGAPAGDVIQFVDGVLAPLLRSTVAMEATPFQALPDEVEGFATDEFRYP